MSNEADARQGGDSLHSIVDPGADGKVPLTSASWRPTMRCAAPKRACRAAGGHAVLKAW